MIVLYNNPDELKSEIRNLIKIEKKGKVVKIFKEILRDSSTDTLDLLKDLIIEAISTDFEYFNDKIYTKIIKKLNKTFSNNDLIKLEKDILEKHCLFDNEKIQTNFSGKVLQGDYYVKGRVYLTQYRIFAQGKFDALLGWFSDKIHRHGKKFTANELLERVTGDTGIKPEPYLNYIKQKFSGIYGLNI